MLRRVSMEGVTLPRLYIAEDSADVRQAVEAGIPFVKWSLGNDALVKIILRPVLEKMFPAVKWDKVLGENPKGHSDIVVVEPHDISSEKAGIDESHDNERAVAEQEKMEGLAATMDPGEEWSESVDVASSWRAFGMDAPEKGHPSRSLWEYLGDDVSCVDLDVLQHLGMLPKFMGDVADCVKVNLSNRMRWTEGYTKKLGVPLGNFGASAQLPNLIILDVSGSIPRGISATMLSMIDTLRSQVDADLIITSDHSVYYPMGSELPSPTKLRRYFGYGNECKEFYSIINKYIAGRKWGHVISFGDYDYPAYWDYDVEEDLDLVGTSVMAVHHYHTGVRLMQEDKKTKQPKTGYALWIDELDCHPDESYDISWCKVIDKEYW